MGWRSHTAGALQVGIQLVIMLSWIGRIRYRKRTSTSFICYRFAVRIPNIVEAEQLAPASHHYHLAPMRTIELQKQERDDELERNDEPPRDHEVK